MQLVQLVVIIPIKQSSSPSPAYRAERASKSVLGTIARPYPISNSQGIRSRGTNHGHLHIKFTFSQEGAGRLLHCEQGKGSQGSLLSLKVSGTEVFQSLSMWFSACYFGFLGTMRFPQPYVYLIAPQWAG